MILNIGNAFDYKMCREETVSRSVRQKVSVLLLMTALFLTILVVLNHTFISIAKVFKV